MTRNADNRTTELREKLDALGIEHFDYDKGGRTQIMWESPEDTLYFTYETIPNPAKTAKLVIEWFPTPKQAIAATLKSRTTNVDDILELLDEMNHVESISYDVYSQLHDAIAELGSETCELAERGTLTAEQVREAVMSADRWEKPMGNTGLTNTHLIIRDDGWQAIADELNAELGSGTCEMRLLWCDYEDGECYECSSCEGMTYTHGWEPSYCEKCGAKVVKR